MERIVDEWFGMFPQLDVLLGMRIVPTTKELK
jgi:hypothetical protein